MDNKINILVIGDSIVYGMGDNEKGHQLICDIVYENIKNNMEENNENNNTTRSKDEEK